MRSCNALTDIIQCLSIIILTFFFDAFIFKDLNITYDWNIPIIDIIGFIITICLALYIAHVVERGREKHKADTEILIDIVRSLTKECELVSYRIYENNLGYIQASALSKRITTQISNLKGILQRLSVESEGINNTLNSISHSNRMLPKLLTEIVYQENDPNNYLEVEDDLITKIAPARVGRIQKALDNLRGKLYALRIEINLIQE